MTDEIGILYFLHIHGSRSAEDILGSADVSNDFSVYDTLYKLENEGKIERFYGKDDKLREFPNYKLTEEFNQCECGNEKPIEEQLCLHCWTLANNFPCECQEEIFEYCNRCELK